MAKVNRTMKNKGKGVLELASASSSNSAKAVTSARRVVAATRKEDSTDPFQQIMDAYALWFDTKQPQAYVKPHYHVPSPRQTYCEIIVTFPNGTTASFASEQISPGRRSARQASAQHAITQGIIPLIRTKAKELQASQEYGSDSDMISPATDPDDYSERDVDSDSSSESSSIAQSESTSSSESVSEGDSDSDEAMARNSSQAPSRSKDDLYRPPWCPAHVEPEWFSYSVRKHASDGVSSLEWGAALRIRLSRSSSRVYHTDTIYSTKSEAFVACDTEAQKAGVLDYIQMERNPEFRSCDGRPTPFPILQRAADGKATTVPRFLAMAIRPRIATDSTPRPTASNAVALFEAALKTSNISKRIFFFKDASHPLWGCLIHLNNKAETRTYLVDPVFRSQDEAQSAACLRAFSLNAMTYLTGLNWPAHRVVSPAMKTLYNKTILPRMTELHDRSRREKFVFSVTYIHDPNLGFGCELKIGLAKIRHRYYTVPCCFESQSDAERAIYFQAIAEGALEYIKFRGEPPPQSWTPVIKQQCLEVLRAADQEATRRLISSTVGQASRAVTKRSRLEAGHIANSSPDPSSRPSKKMKTRANEDDEDEMDIVEPECSTPQSPTKREVDFSATPLPSKKSAMTAGEVTGSPLSPSNSDSSAMFSPRVSKVSQATKQRDIASKGKKPRRPRPIALSQPTKEKSNKCDIGLPLPLSGIEVKNPVPQ